MTSEQAILAAAELVEAWTWLVALLLAAGSLLFLWAVCSSSSKHKHLNE